MHKIANDIRDIIFFDVERSRVEVYGLMKSLHIYYAVASIWLLIFSSIDSLFYDVQIFLLLILFNSILAILVSIFTENKWVLTFLASPSLLSQAAMVIILELRLHEHLVKNTRNDNIMFLPMGLLLVSGIWGISSSFCLFKQPV